MMITAWGINNWGGEEVSEHDDRERERGIKQPSLAIIMLTLDGLDVYIIVCTPPPPPPLPPSCWGGRGPFRNYPFRGDWTKGGT